MTHPIVLVMFLLVGTYCGYFAVLAIVCISRDHTLTAVNKFGRTFLALLLPMIGPAVAIRSTAETAPEALPGPRWLWPVRFLLADGVEPVQEAEKVLPGVTTHTR